MQPAPTSTLRRVRPMSNPSSPTGMPPARRMMNSVLTWNPPKKMSQIKRNASVSIVDRWLWVVPTSRNAKVVVTPATADGTVRRLTGHRTGTTVLHSAIGWLSRTGTSQAPSAATCPVPTRGASVCLKFSPSTHGLVRIARVVQRCCRLLWHINVSQNGARISSRTGRTAFSVMLSTLKLRWTGMRRMMLVVLAVLSVLLSVTGLLVGAMRLRRQP